MIARVSSEAHWFCRNRCSQGYRSGAGRLLSTTAETGPHNKGPLKHIKVLDFTRLLPGPLCTNILRRLGAQIIKVDAVEGGDYVRSIPPLHSFPNGSTHGALYESLNAGKLELGLNIKHADAATVVQRLCKHVDVVVEGNRPGVMDKHGLGYQHLAEHNPRLIYCSLTGYGATGPYAKRAGHDVNYMATSGVLGLTKSSPLLGFQAADATGAMQAVIGILSSIIDRSSTNMGQFVDISLTESAMALAVPSLSQALAMGTTTAAGQGMLDGGLPNYNIYLTADQRALAVGALEPHFWAKICKAVDRLDLLQRTTTQSEVRALFASKTMAEWMSIADATDTCLEPVMTVQEMSAHPQHIARKAVLPADDQQALPTQLVLGPRLSAHPIDRLPPARPLGADSKGVLLAAGFTPEEVDKLVADGVVHSV